MAMDGIGEVNITSYDSVTILFDDFFLGLSMYQEKERMKKQSINSTN